MSGVVFFLFCSSLGFLACFGSFVCAGFPGLQCVPVPAGSFLWRILACPARFALCRFDCSVYGMYQLAKSALFCIV